MYHYSKLDEWFGIKNGSYKTKYVPGLAANLRLAPESEEGWRIGCSFSLFESEPVQWVNSEIYPHVWEELVIQTGDLILEVNVRNNWNNTFVVDWARRESFLSGNNKGLTGSEEVKLDRDSSDSYVESMIHIEEYLENSGNLNYELPEVIVTKTVPLSDIKVSGYQPKLERVLSHLREVDGCYDINRYKIALIPELREWSFNHGDKDLLRVIDLQIEREKEFSQRRGVER